MINLWHKLLVIKEFLSYAKDPSAEGVARFIHLFKRIRRRGSEILFKEMLEHIRSDENANRLIDERYLPKPFTQEDLQHYPQKTLGEQFGLFLKKNNLKLDIYARFEIKSDIEYVSFRGGQVHDIWHVVTGFDVDHFGEFALQAFTFAQTKSPIVAMFLAGDILYASGKGPAFSFKALQAVTEGFSLGCRVPNFYGVKWEECFSMDLEKLRQILGLKRHNELHNGDSVVSVQI